MAKKDDQDSQFNPKHRIVGAIIIVSLAVIFVPMILKNDPDGLRKDKERLSHLVDKDTKVYVTKVTPTPAASSDKKADDKPAATAASKKDDSKKTTATTTVAKQDTKKTPEAKPVAKTADKKASTRTASSTTTQSAATNKGWIIQVGTFADKRNAGRVSRKLKQAGFKVISTNIVVDRKDKTTSAVRIRVGPFAQRAIAQKKLLVVNRTVGVEGIVIAQP